MPKRSARVCLGELRLFWKVDMLDPHSSARMSMWYTYMTAGMQKPITCRPSCIESFSSGGALPVSPSTAGSGGL